MRYQPSYKITYSNKDIGAFGGGEKITQFPVEAENALRRCGYQTVRTKAVVVVKVLLTFSTCRVTVRTFFAHGPKFGRMGFCAIGRSGK